MKYCPIKIIFLFVTFGLVGCNTTSRRRSPTKGIYGDDGRKDLFEANLSPAQRMLADSTAIMIGDRSVSITPSGDGILPMKTWGAWANVCPSERFADQPAPGSCSGFLDTCLFSLRTDHCLVL